MPSLGSTMEDFQQKMYSVMRSIKKHSMNTNVLPKHCIFDFPLSELSKIKCKSNYFGNEIPCPKGEGGALKMTRNGYKKIGKCSGKKVPFPLPGRLLILGSSRNGAWGKSWWAAAFAGGWPWGNRKGRPSRENGDPLGSLCDFVLFSRCTVTWLLASYDSSMTCVTCKAMQSDVPNSMLSPSESTLQASASPHFPGLGPPPQLTGSLWGSSSSRKLFQGETDGPWLTMIQLMVFHLYKGGKVTSIQ